MIATKKKQQQQEVNTKNENKQKNKQTNKEKAKHSLLENKPKTREIWMKLFCFGCPGSKFNLLLVDLLRYQVIPTYKG